MDEVVLLCHHPVETIHILIPLGYIASEGVVLSPQGLKSVLVHRSDGEVHPTKALFGAQLRRVREILNHDGIPGFLNHLGTDHHSAEVPGDPTDEGTRLRFEPNLDVSEPRDVGADQLPKEVVSAFLPLLLEDSAARERLFSRMRAN